MDGCLDLIWNLRENWGYEINLSLAKSKDEGIDYTSYDATFSSWYRISPNGMEICYGGYSRTYNFSREYLAFYSWLVHILAGELSIFLELGTSFDMFIEGNPEGNIADITYNARPFISLKPVNDLNIRVYVDNVYSTESQRLESMIVGLLFSWNFLPKSWVYFAFNDFRDRSDRYDSMGNLSTEQTTCNRQSFSVEVEVSLLFLIKNITYYFKKSYVCPNHTSNTGKYKNKQHF